MSRKSASIIITAILLSAFLQGCKKEAIEITTVKSANGLVLRDGPDLQAKKIVVIPHRAKVEILTYSNIISVIGGKTAPWVEVRYKDKEGWVFSAFLANYASQEFDDLSKIGTFSQSPFEKKIFSRVIGRGIKESLLKNLPGTPDVKTIDKENRHDSSIIDKQHTIKGSGVTVTLYEAVKLKKEMLMAVEVTGNTVPLKYGVSIGMKSADIEKIFGTPKEKKSEELVYFTSDAVPVTVIFTLNNDKLKKILIAYRID